MKELGKSGMKFRHGGGGYEKWPKKPGRLFCHMTLTQNFVGRVQNQSKSYGQIRYRGKCMKESTYHGWDILLKINKRIVPNKSI